MEEDPFIRNLAKQNKIPEDKVKSMMRDLGVKTNAELLAERVKIDFNRASTTTGAERERHAMAIWNLKSLISPEEWRMVLRSLFTTPEAIQELIRKGREEEKEVNRLSSRIKRFLSRQD